MKTLNEQDINLLRSSSGGGYTGKLVKFCQRLTNRKAWKSGLLGLNVTDDNWRHMLQISGWNKQNGINKTRQKLRAKKDLILNAQPKPDGWHWKPPQPTPVKRESKNHKHRGIKAERRANINLLGAEFYSTKEWLSLRIRVFEKYECKCMMCGRSPKLHGVVIHIDHIKPRSKFPELSLEFTNLQILCEDCNLGKSNKYQTDYRPDANDTDYQILESLPVTMQ